MQGIFKDIYFEAIKILFKGVKCFYPAATNALVDTLGGKWLIAFN